MFHLRINQLVYLSICIFTYNVTLPQVFFKHFVSKNQLTGLSVNGTLVENELKITLWILYNQIFKGTLLQIWKSTDTFVFT